MSEATAMTISGTTRVRYTTESNGARNRGFILARARAAQSPSTVEMTAAAAAICRLVTMAGMKVGSCRPALNQQEVNPFQTVMLPIWSGGMPQMLEPWKAASAGADGLLNAKITITRIGRYRKAYTSTAQAVNPCLALTRLATEALLLPGEQDVDDDEYRQDRHQRDRQSRAERLILGLLELVTDDVPDELVISAAQDVGDDELAGHRDEHQQGTGDHARKGESQRDLPERRERARPQVGGGLDQRPVHPLQRGEHRQDEQRQVVVHQAHGHRVLGVQDVDAKVPGQIALRVQDDLQC